MRPVALEAGQLAGAARLVTRLQAGERAAFRELFQAYRELVYRLGCHLLGDDQEAADLAQEVFLTVYRRIGTLRNSAALRPWICRITVTRARNRQRYLRRRRARAHVALDSDGRGGRELAALGRDPEQALMAEEWRELVSRGLEQVGFPYRAAVIMRDLEGLSYDEIAVSLGIRVGTVKSRIARGREELRRALKEML